MQCEVRLAGDKEPLLPNTKCVMLLGKLAVDMWLGKNDNTLGEVRGSVYMKDGIAHIPSYLPVDCIDMKDYESDHNELLAGLDHEADAKEVKGNEKRRHGITARSNFRFWLKKDTEKAIKILLNGGKIPEPSIGAPEYVIWPSSEEVIDALLSHKNNCFYYDIETDVPTFNMQCFSFSFDGTNKVWCVPVLNHLYEQAYGRNAAIFRAKALAIRDNTIVSHNGHTFDWLILPWKYGIPMGHRFYDTMLAQHRCYPDVEKSLGHCTSLHTFESFHKDEGSGGYYTPDEVRRKLAYCGKDVYTMKLIKHAIDEYATKIPGLAKSIAQVNKSVRGYLTMTLQGIHYKQEILQETMHENDRLMMQYLRMIKILVGDDIIRTFAKRYKGSLPSSNPQCVTYFHEMLGYSVVGRGKVKKNGTRGPSLGKKHMYSLRLKQENPVIDLTLAYRETAKESGALKFTPWMQNIEQLTQ